MFVHQVHMFLAGRNCKQGQQKFLHFILTYAGLLTIGDVMRDLEGIVRLWRQDVFIDTTTTLPTTNDLHQYVASTACIVSQPSTLHRTTKHSLSGAGFELAFSSKYECSVFYALYQWFFNKFLPTSFGQLRGNKAVEDSMRIRIFFCVYTSFLSRSLYTQISGCVRIVIGIL